KATVDSAIATAVNNASAPTPANRAASAGLAAAQDRGTFYITDASPATMTITSPIALNWSCTLYATNTGLITLAGSGVTLVNADNEFSIA
ncbi:hypothetical protein ACI3PL_23015, partial [Lacticaseibacillus paracasei]